MLDTGKQSRPGSATEATRNDHFDGNNTLPLPVESKLGDALTNADSWWRDCAWRALEHLAATGRPFTAYDVTELGVPDPDHGNRWGGLFQAACKAGLIEPVGYAESRRPSRAGGVCRVWKGTAK